MVIIDGEIQTGDALNFLNAADKAKRALVLLRSPGGVVDEALQIGAEIRTRNYATTVLKECVSAGGLIWLSGRRRYLNEGSRLGFHAAYRMRDKMPVETGMANAEVGSYLTHLGLNIAAIRVFDSSAAKRCSVARDG